MKTLLFVDDEPRVLQGLQRQLHGLRHEWQMNFVESGPQALQFMAGTPVDVLISDMMMPGMDGAQLLTEVMKRHPHTVRLVLSGHADREAVLRCVGPAHQYLSKPCNPEELRAAITRALALRTLLSSEPLKQLASRVRCLPSLPALHAQLTDELRKEDPSLERVADIISKDMGMATKILQLVNSAFFGLPQPVANIQEAVVYLGTATIRALVLSLHVFSRFDQQALRGFSIDGLTQHCWETGVLARRIAQGERSGPKMDDQCFLGGLLHDVGHLVLAAGVPEPYARVLRLAREQSRPLWEIEQGELGAGHAEVGAYLLGLWGLPNPIIEAVAFHHRPAVSCARGFSPLIAVHVADALLLDQGSPGVEPVALAVNAALLAQLGLSDKIEEWKTRYLQPAT